MKYNIKNRDGDAILFVQIEPGHWRVAKLENYFGIQVQGTAPNYVAADFIGGGPFIGIGDSINSYVPALETTEIVTKIFFDENVMNGFDLLTKAQ